MLGSSSHLHFCCHQLLAEVSPGNCSSAVPKRNATARPSLHAGKGVLLWGESRVLELELSVLVRCCCKGVSPQFRRRAALLHPRRQARCFARQRQAATLCEESRGEGFCARPEAHAFEGRSGLAGRALEEHASCWLDLHVAGANDFPSDDSASSCADSSACLYADAAAAIEQRGRVAAAGIRKCC